MDNSFEVTLFESKNNGKDSYFLFNETIYSPDFLNPRKIMPKYKALLIIEGLKRFYKENSEEDIDSYNEEMERQSFEKKRLYEEEKEESSQAYNKKLHDDFVSKFDKSLIESEKIENDDIKNLLDFKKFYTKNDIIAERKDQVLDETYILFLRRNYEITFIWKHKSLEYLLVNYVESLDKKTIAGNYKFDDFAYKRVKSSKCANLMTECIVQLKPEDNQDLPENTLYKRIEKIHKRYKIPLSQILKIIKENNIEIIDVFNKQYIRIEDLKKISNKLSI